MKLETDTLYLDRPKNIAFYTIQKVKVVDNDNTLRK